MYLVAPPGKVSSPAARVNRINVSDIADSHSNSTNSFGVIVGGDKDAYANT